MPTQFRTVLKEKLQYINEAKEDPVVDGKYVLAKVIGPMALCDGTSLNGRYYPKEVWETVRDESTERLAEGGIFGTVGHNVEFDEDTLAGGQVSHKVKKLWISEDGKYLMGEIHVLNTDSGRNIDVYLREGYPLAVSTRAYGELKKGKGPGGSDLVEAKGIYLESIDFVSTPGVTATKSIRVVENQAKMIDESKKEKRKMDLEKICETLQVEKMDLKESVNEALRENKNLKEQVSLLESQNKQYQQKIVEGLRKWQSLEPFKSLAKRTGLWDGDNGMRQPEPIAEAFHIMEGLFPVCEQYASLGAPQAIKEKLEFAHKIQEEYGDIQEHEAVYLILKEYQEIGKEPKKIKESLAQAQKVRAIYKQEVNKINCKKLSRKFKVSEAFVADLLKDNKAKVVEEKLKLLRKQEQTNENYSAQSATNSGANVRQLPTNKKGNETGTAAGRILAENNDTTPVIDRNKQFLENLMKGDPRQKQNRK